MASMIHGIAVELHQKVQSGVDDFNAPVYTITPVVVDNVLVTPLDTGAVTNATTLAGRRMACELSLPKGDAHDWTNVDVVFWGRTWHTYGDVKQWIEDLVPLDWNRKVLVEWYG